ncbi:hypothetical protein SAMN02745163_04582 [Clostridium cavendishii DSM 21758]|uniref:Uncharacterized protein n=1 Tax=Clostridium cavendishii DSM 21758 TaxID=1121302 RepID=A0A1M6VX09_9CLOT|nr:hypothetical protein [Clostridium cavendishii]SHK86010.1 hypothetical protein SAMN02745163_04582 [Clostridium cavendishii DSM 21758]
MKVKVIDSNLKDFGLEFKVRRMNYDQVIVRYPEGDGLFTFTTHQVELISEGEVDEILIKYPCLLKIKIHRGVSVFFYKAFLENLHTIMDDEELSDINLLKDVYKEVNKKGLWEKNMILVINEKYPLVINATGIKFRKSNYEFDSKVIEPEEFKELCEFEMKKIKEQIEHKNILLERYELALNEIEEKENEDEGIKSARVNEV